MFSCSWQDVSIETNKENAFSLEVRGNTLRYDNKFFLAKIKFENGNIPDLMLLVTSEIYQEPAGTHLEVFIHLPKSIRNQPEP